MTGILRAAFEKARDAMVITAANGTVLDWNPAAARLFQRSSEEVVRKRLATFCRDLPALESLICSARDEGYARNDVTFYTPEAEEVIGHTSVFRLDDSDRQEFLWLICDVTERRRTEQSLQESYQLFEKYAQYSPAALWLGTPGGKLKFMSFAFETMTGMQTSDLRDLQHWTELIHPDDRAGFQRNAERYSDGGRIRHQYRIIRLDGGTRWIQSDGFSIRNANGETSYWGGFLQDITDQHEAYEKLQRALEEREMLLKEIHHRVKNNLQIISSLLRLQSLTADPTSALVLQESRNRVDAIAFLHEHLYQSENVAGINFPSYVKRLIANLISVSQTPPETVQVNTDIDAISFKPQTAVLCGLILNELVYNSLRHAFPHGRTGELDVQMKATGKGAVTMVVRDNGVGIPNGFDIQQIHTLGLKLVRQLTRQLRGTLSVSDRKGTIVRIEFPAEQAV